MMVSLASSQIDDTTRPAAVWRHDLRLAIAERPLGVLEIAASPSCHPERQPHGSTLSRQVLQATDTPSVAAVGAGATCWTLLAAGYDRVHDPARMTLQPGVKLGFAQMRMVIKPCGMVAK